MPVLPVLKREAFSTLFVANPLRTRSPMSQNDPDKPAPPAKRRASGLILRILLVLSLAAIGYLSVALADATDEQRQRKVVEAAARLFARELTTYSHETIQEDIEEVVALSTGSFKRDYQRAQGGKAFQDALVEAQGSSSGRLVAVAVRSISDEEAEVVAILDQTVKNNKQTEPRTERRFLELLMVRTSSGWKTDRVSVL